MSKKKSAEHDAKRIVLGDDAVENSDADWFNFEAGAVAVADQLLDASKTSGVCFGIIGSWGNGKSSFMKLMDEYINKRYPEEICSVWFKAWDPGGIDDLGDAMLYHLFHSVAGKHKSLDNAFKELQEALGIRKSIRERASRALGIVSKGLPESGRMALDAVAGIVGELDAPRKVEESFDKLMSWLEENDLTVFLFVDDLDRATGVQIRDILSELKVYVSHRRIIAVLGYDADYVLNALKPPVLPDGTDPAKYIEKIVTVRRKLPRPDFGQAVSYAKELLKLTLDLNQQLSYQLGLQVAKLSLFNPRKMKNLILGYSSCLKSMDYKKLNLYTLSSSLICYKADDLGLFAQGETLTAFETASEEEMIAALEKQIAGHPAIAEEINGLISSIKQITPNFIFGTVSRLRFGVSYPSVNVPAGLEETLQHEEFEWSDSFFPILSKAASHGFELPSRIVVSSKPTTIPPAANVYRGKLSRLGGYAQILRMPEGVTFDQPEFLKVSWKEYDMLILKSSSLRGRWRAELEPPRSFNSALWLFFESSPDITVNKSFILWVIDDVGIFTQKSMEDFSKQARQKSKGLKHSFIFQYTLPPAIESLITYLLNVGSK